jgi:hypothetical protein
MQPARTGTISVGLALAVGGSLASATPAQSARIGWGQERFYSSWSLPDPVRPIVGLSLRGDGAISVFGGNGFGSGGSFTRIGLGCAGSRAAALIVPSDLLRLGTLRMHVREQIGGPQRLRQ